MNKREVLHLVFIKDFNIGIEFPTGKEQKYVKGQTVTFYDTAFANKLINYGYAVKK